MNSSDMKYTIKATDIGLSTDLHEYVDKKMASLDKFVKKMGDAVEAHVEVARTSRHHKTGNVFRVEILMHIPGAELYAEALGKTVLEAMDAVKDEMSRELEKNKDKKVDAVRRGGSARKNEAQE